MAPVGLLPVVIVKLQREEFELGVEIGVDVHLLFLHQVNDPAVDDGLLLGLGVGDVGIGGAALELSLLGEDVRYGAGAVRAVVVFRGARSRDVFLLLPPWQAEVAVALRRAGGRPLAAVRSENGVNGLDLSSPFHDRCAHGQSPAPASHNVVELHVLQLGHILSDVGLLHHVGTGEEVLGGRGYHDATWRADGLNLACDGHIPRPDIKFEPSRSHDSAEDRARVYPNSHLDWQLGPPTEVIKGVHDGQPHVHAVVGVVNHGLGAAGDTEIAVSERADLFTLVLCDQLIKSGEDFVENANQFRSGEAGRELGEIDNVGKEDGDPIHLAHSKRS